MADRLARELDRWSRRTAYGADDDLVFAHPQSGRSLDRTKLSRRFKQACADAGVRPVRFHDLRHTFATRLAASGQPMRTIQEFLGHADSKTTQIYAHYAPSAHEVEMVNAAFAEETPPEPELAGTDAAGDNVTGMFDNVEQHGDKDVGARLYALAEGRAGYITSRDAAEAGIPRSTLSHHARPGGRLVHVARGLYRLRDFPSSPHEHIVAGWLRTPPSADAVVSHGSALELDDLSDVIADAVHVTVPRAQRRKPIDGVVIHPTTFPVTQRQRREVQGMPVTTVDRTVVDVLRAAGLTEQIEVAVAEALRRGLTTKRRLRSTAAEFPKTVQRQVAELTR